jgi:YHS domain-containing protein
MLKLLVWLVLGYVLFRIVKGFAAQKKVDQPHGNPSDEEAVCDPVCGVYLSKDDAVVGRLNGEPVYFCSSDCREKHREQLEQSAARKIQS